MSMMMMKMLGMGMGMGMLMIMCTRTGQGHGYDLWAASMQIYQLIGEWRGEGGSRSNAYVLFN